MDTKRQQQRFENYQNSFEFLRKVLQESERTDVVRAAIIQAFEMTFELSWKLLQDHLIAGGHKVQSPREVIKQAVHDEIIENGEMWLDALEKRNATVHLYDEKQSIAVVEKIDEEYFALFEQLHASFSSKF